MTPIEIFVLLFFVHEPDIFYDIKLLLIIF